MMIEMREALVKICDEGIGKCIDRFYFGSKYLQDELQNVIGLEMFVDQAQRRLPTIIIAKLPHRVRTKIIVKYLTQRYD